MHSWNKGIQDTDWLKEMAHTFPGRIYLSVDAYGEDIKVNGWEEDTELNLFSFCETVIGYTSWRHYIY